MGTEPECGCCVCRGDGSLRPAAGKCTPKSLSNRLCPAAQTLPHAADVGVFIWHRFLSTNLLVFAAVLCSPCGHCQISEPGGGPRCEAGQLAQG